MKHLLYFSLVVQYSKRIKAMVTCFSPMTIWNIDSDYYIKCFNFVSSSRRFFQVPMYHVFLKVIL